MKGNSGSPIIDPGSGRVIAIAAYLKLPSKHSKVDKDSPYMTVRRFGYRIDNNMNWEAANQTQLYEQSKLFDDVEERTEALANIIYVLRNEDAILTSYKSHPTLGYVLKKFDKEFTWGKGPTAKNIDAFNHLKRGLRDELDRDIKTAQRKLRYGFYASALARQVIYRDMLLKELASTIWVK